MKKIGFSIIAILFLNFTTGCDNASFDSSGDPIGFTSLGSEIEIIPENNLNDKEFGDEGEILDSPNLGENSISSDDDHQTPPNQNAGEDEANHTPQKPPSEIWEDPELVTQYSCGNHKQKKKLYICHWPNNDESKARTLCVSANSVGKLLHSSQTDKTYRRGCSNKNQKHNSGRQDTYFLGACLN